MQVTYYTQLSPSGATILRILVGQLNSHQECIDYIEYLEERDLGNFCLYNAIKYLWRLGVKSDSVVNELTKCRDYLKRYGSRIPFGDRYWITEAKLEMTIDAIERSIAIELNQTKDKATS